MVRFARSYPAGWEFPCGHDRTSVRPTIRVVKTSTPENGSPTDSQGCPRTPSGPWPNEDQHLLTLGLAAGLTLLTAGGMILTGFVVQALFMTITACVLFVVAFATAPLFGRLRLAWPSHAAVLGATLGWALSAPLGALVNSATNAMNGVTDPYEFLPMTWAWALIPWMHVVLVTGIRQVLKARYRY